MLRLTVWGRASRRIPATGACFLCFLLTTPTLSLNATTPAAFYAIIAEKSRPTPPPPAAPTAMADHACPARVTTDPSTRHECLDLSRTGTRPDPGKRAFAAVITFNYDGHRAADSRYYVGRRGSARGAGPRCPAACWCTAHCRVARLRSPHTTTPMPPAVAAHPHRR